MVRVPAVGELRYGFKAEVISVVPVPHSRKGVSAVATVGHPAAEGELQCREREGVHSGCKMVVNPGGAQGAPLSLDSVSGGVCGGWWWHPQAGRSPVLLKQEGGLQHSLGTGSLRVMWEQRWLQPHDLLQRRG